MSEKLDRVIELLESINKWVKLTGVEKAKQVIEKEFSDETKTLVYHLSDGRSSDDIERLLNKKTTDNTIRTWWKRWSKMGIMEIHPNYKKRYWKTFDLEDFGIEIPEVTENVVQEPVKENKEVENNVGQEQ
ncbi:MAG: hypothetical protein HY361_00550 [Candidatus Aenigmarchaeota archaeon]|nr:hypothetical protein [Candidatus Aenigmarchaeota archaeon]